MQFKSLRSWRLPILGLLAAIGIILGITACGGGSNSGSNVANSSYSDQTCFTEMTPDQKAQLVDYVNEQANAQVQNTVNNGDGTQDICVLQSDGSGGYNQRYYNSNDGFSDYLLYAAMFGHSNTLMTYGLISGDLDVGDYLTLQLLTGVNGNGGLYHPYTYTNSGWGRSNSTISNTTVNHIYYGSRDAGGFSTAHTQAPPAGYSAVTVRPASDSEATASRGSNGQVVVTQTAASGAHAVLSTAQVATPTPLKANGSVSAIPNPATSATSNPKPSTTAAPVTTADAAPTTSRQSTTAAPTPKTTSAQPAPTTSRRSSAPPQPTSKRSSAPRTSRR